MDITNLLSVPVGYKAAITSLEISGSMRRRLLDLGLTPGTDISCLFQAPSGNPRAYLIRGAVIALRNQDAEKITVGGISSWA